MRIRIFAATLCVATAYALSAAGAVTKPDCTGVDPKASQAFAPVSAATCHTQMKNGYPVPDPTCTPGAINPSLTLSILKHPSFRTECVRDKATSASAKAATYGAYSIDHPKMNTGDNQTCELDHLVSLELGGADTLDNIWPQCGPPDVDLKQRYFKQKDAVENYLADEVKAGHMSMHDTQAGIAADWTQYLAAATVANPKKHQLDFVPPISAKVAHHRRKHS
jgi:hypothetical protein